MPELQFQRFELKYVVADALAVHVRDFVSAYLTLDEFGATRPDLSYPVHSLYLDSADQSLYQSTINGDRNRYKLRIRFYEGRDNDPVFFEIKRREDCAIYKLRCAVRRESVGDLVAGRMPVREDLAAGGPREELAMHTFCKLVNQINAKPAAHVSYMREAWISQCSSRLRVTMDRKIRITPESRLVLDTRLHDTVPVFGTMVVLELKFTGRFPNWMREMVEFFELRQGSAAKYVDGIDRIKSKPCRKSLKNQTSSYPHIESCF
jgi:hypothetical protein